MITKETINNTKGQKESGSEDLNPLVHPEFVDQLRLKVAKELVLLDTNQLLGLRERVPLEEREREHCKN